VRHSVRRGGRSARGEPPPRRKALPRRRDIRRLPDDARSRAARRGARRIVAVHAPRDLDRGDRSRPSSVRREAAGAVVAAVPPSAPTGRTTGHGRFQPALLAHLQPRGDLVRRGAIGTPLHLEFGLHIDVRRWSSVTKHRLDAVEGGVLHDLGGHAIDLATQIVGGEPDSIAARSITDRIELQLDFAGGSSARCDVAYSDRTREWLAVRGPQGSVRLAEPNMVLHAGNGGLLRNRVMAPLVDAAALGFRGLLRSRSIGRATIRAALASFAASVRTGTAFTPGFADGVRNALWVEAAARSLASDGAPRQPASR
jgi:hypothetical protein